VQSVGMAFSLVLLLPSWGSAANGLLTFNGSWHLLRTDPAAKFMVLSLVFYAVSTFEGSMMAIRTVNSLSHYTEWTVAHVHAGALGWVAMITIGSLYAMAPRALGRPMHSHGAMELHFWLHIAGVLLYLVAMWTAGVMQGVMWRATEPDGSLTYPFIESLTAITNLYFIRWFAGLLILAGMVVMAWNLWHTAGDARKKLIVPIVVPIPEPDPHQRPAPLPAAT
jgi:cytochrome c oxidase cbb3-type subunit 1